MKIGHAEFRHARSLFVSPDKTLPDTSGIDLSTVINMTAMPSRVSMFMGQLVMYGQLYGGNICLCEE